MRSRGMPYPYISIRDGAERLSCSNRACGCFRNLSNHRGIPLDPAVIQGRFPDKSSTINLKVQNAILDGEIVCLDSEGRSRLNLLLRHRAEPALYAFDLLWLNWKDLRQLPLIERKSRLRKLIEKSDCWRIIYAPHIEMRGCVLYRAICKKDLEGIVAKRRDSVYSVSGHWLMVLNPNYTQLEGRHEKFTAF
jgi:hypothetical protein